MNEGEKKGKFMVETNIYVICGVYMEYRNKNWNNIWVCLLWGAIQKLCTFENLHLLIYYTSFRLKSCSVEFIKMVNIYIYTQMQWLYRQNLMFCASEALLGCGTDAKLVIELNLKGINGNNCHIWKQDMN